jgi:hypothetical protein
VWKLTYALPLWRKLLEEETGWGIQRLLQIPSSMGIPFFDEDYIKETMRRIVRRAIDEQGWQPILDIVKEMPCEEDFERWDTNVRKSFLRKWHHTRTKTKMVSLEACMENEEIGIYEIADESTDVAESVASEDYCQRFRERLSQKDMEILKLRLEGFTYEEIADRLGYKTHSGIIKRMRHVAKEFTKYEEEQK